MRKWLNYEIEYLQQNYSKLGPKLCCQYLNKPISSVHQRAHKLNLLFDRNKPPEGFKRCSWCKRTLSFDNFIPSSLAKRRGQGHCKECKNKDTKKRLQKAKAADEETRKFWCLRRIFHNSKNRAKSKGMEFDLDLEWIMKNLPPKCPVTNENFEFMSKRESKNYSPSLDRIDNTKGYLKDNVVIVMNKINSIKRDATVAELRKIADFYTKLEQEKSPIDYEI